MTRPVTVLALGGSAGCLPIMIEIARKAAGLDHAALFFVYHQGGTGPFQWELLLPPYSGIRASAAHDNEEVLPNTLYHSHDAETMLVSGGRLHSVPEPGRPRPKIDRLFTSLAKEHGSNTIAFLLSGMGSDGVQGMRAIQEANGYGIIQHPATAEFPDLPTLGLEAGVGHEVMTPPEIVKFVLDTLRGEPPPRRDTRA